MPRKLAPFDPIQARELELHYENSEPLYRQGVLWQQNFERKMKRGVFQKGKAVGGIARNFIPQVIRSYTKEYASPGPVSKRTKVYLGNRFVGDWLGERSIQQRK